MYQSPFVCPCKPRHKLADHPIPVSIPRRAALHASTRQGTLRKGHFEPGGSCRHRRGLGAILTLPENGPSLLFGSKARCRRRKKHGKQICTTIRTVTVTNGDRSFAAGRRRPAELAAQGRLRGSETGKRWRVGLGCSRSDNASVQSALWWARSAAATRNKCDLAASVSFLLGWVWSTV